jgi:hypothetical protein
MPFPQTDFVLPYSGAVMRPFPFEFQHPIIEQWDFLTDVITASDQSEQRIGVRDPSRPRHRVRATVVAFERDEAQHLDARLYGGNAKPYCVPMWMDAMVLATETDVDDTVLTVLDAEGRDLTGRLAEEVDVPVLLWAAHDDWEPALLASVDEGDGELTLVNGVAREWPAGTMVVPLRMMLAPSEIEIERPAKAAALVTLEFVSSQIPVVAGVLCAVESDALKVQMVRPSGGQAAVPIAREFSPNDVANSPAPGMPVSSDPPAEWTLYGFTKGILFSVGSTIVPARSTTAMMAEMKGLTTKFKYCTGMCRNRFDKRLLVGRTIGTNVPGDAAWGLYTDGAEVAGIPDHIPDYDVGGVISGTGYAPAPSAPTTRNLLAAAFSLRGGLGESGTQSFGDRIVSYGLYNPMYPGGIEPFEVTPNIPANTLVVELKYGYAFRCVSIQDFKKLKVVVELVDNPMDDPEDWTYGAPQVTEHTFTMDEKEDSVPTSSGFVPSGEPYGAYVEVLTGGGTLFGNVHPVVSYADEFENVWYRVHVTLIDNDDVEHDQYIDHFRPMWVDVELVP